jgi:hypothetical protein
VLSCAADPDRFHGTSKVRDGGSSKSQCAWMFRDGPSG